MADPIKDAKHELHEVRQEQRTKAAEFWQDTVNQGRLLRQQAQDRTQQRAPDRADRGRDDD